MTKKELRIKYKDIRSDVEEASVKNDEITRKFIQSDLFRSFGKLFLYYPSGSEVSTVKIAEIAFSEGKKVAFPRCINRCGSMEFRFIDTFSDLTDGMFGLTEPDVKRSTLAEPDSDTLIVVPALAFDTAGHRLGYGGGYYDRYLSRFSCFTVGLAFSDCLCNSLPSNEYDVKINCLITDSKIHFFNETKEV